MLSAERSRTYRAGSLPANTSAGLPQTPDIRCRSDHTVWKEFHEGNIQVIKNFDGKAYEQGDDMVQILANHVISPVKFRKSIETMLEIGVDTFVEIGPGKTLSGFVKKE